MAAKQTTAIGYHASTDLTYVATNQALIGYRYDSEFTYTFENFFHPYVGELIQQLNRGSIGGLLDPAFQQRLTDDFFAATYGVADQPLVKVRHFPKEIDVRDGGPYAVYNWELMFHVPLTIAVHLSKNQRFAEAQRWFHYIFDPTANDTTVDVPQRYWKFRAFRTSGAGRQIDELLALLSKPADECTPEELELKGTILAGYEAIRNRPFQPHAVARTRQIAYRYCVVMNYLDNLIAWGDSLFRQDTIESINEAGQLYVLAANLLGSRPEPLPPRGNVRARTFAQLKAQGLDAMGNALVDLEGAFPLNLGVPAGSGAAAGSAPLFGLGRTLYFAVPRNDKLLGYWDTVADRLSKMRHGMNLQGVVRPLALFDPPLDPGMLVKAAAAGIDIGAIVAGVNQPVSPVRAQVLIARALELSGEVRNLGNALLTAIEKGDAESLALLRQGHEVKIHQMQAETRYLQWKQAQESTESLLRTRAVTLEKYTSYLRLLGQPVDATQVPDTFALDRRELTADTFDEAYAALVGQYDLDVPQPAYPDLGLAGDQSPTSDIDGLGKLSLIKAEGDELDHLGSAKDLGLAASIVDATSSAMVFIPDINADLHYWGLGGTMKINIGTAIIKILEITSKGLQMAAVYNREQAGISHATAGHARRADEWIQQANVAGRELRQIGRQLIASLISEQIAEREYHTVQKQIMQAQAVDRFLHEKFTNAELFGWMQGELSRLYYEYYRFAFDLARRSEQTLKRELMRPELDAKQLVQFNYWDGGRRGLLSGEALFLDVKRMELAYHEHNLREYELTKNVSLLQVDPLALITLRTTGRCSVRLPESLFDLDGPGHYFRRIRSLAVSVACTVGPYVSVNCKVTQLSSSIRTSPALDNGGYARAGMDDPRFTDSFGSVQSVVASTAQQDSGLFETNLKDDRYLPFENAGAIGEYQIELPGNPSQGDPTQFDYATITDVVLHLRFTARDGNAPLRAAALQQIRATIAAADVAGSVRMFSLRQEFPTEWARFLAQTPAAGRRHELAFTLRPEHYPYWSQRRLTNVVAVNLLARSSDAAPPATLAVSDRADKADAGTATDALPRNKTLGNLLVGKLAHVPAPAEPTGDIRLYFEHNRLSDLWLAVTWSG
jgi:acylphosphatase